MNANTDPTRRDAAPLGALLSSSVPTPIEGTAGDDVITGSAGDDVIVAGAGSDTLDGGDGSDTFLVGRYEGFDTYVDTGTSGTDRIVATAGEIAIGLTRFGPTSGIESISSGGFAGVTIRGDDGGDVLDFSATQLDGIAAIETGAGDDIVTGSAGDDVVAGGTGSDTLDGGDGSDTFLVGRHEGFDTYVDTGTVGVDRILAASVEMAIGLTRFGPASGIELIDSNGHAGVTIRGDEGSDILDFSATRLEGIERIETDAGDDVVTGSAGDDVIAAGSGSDTLDGGDGSDSYLVGRHEGFDRYADTGTSGTDLILATAHEMAIGLTRFGPASGIEAISGNGFGRVTIQGSEAGDDLDFSQTALVAIDAVDGGAGDDRIVGSSGFDDLFGGDGADEIDGGHGRDWLYGGNGDDRLTGGAGSDVLQGGAGNDVLDGADGGDSLFGDAGDDILIGGAATDLHYGGDGNDRLTGAGGNDFLNGGDGDDLLDGGDGRDELDGGVGNDRLLAGAGNDRITAGSGADVVDAGAGDDSVELELDAADLVDGGEGIDRLVVRAMTAGDEVLELGANVRGFEVFSVSAGSGNDRLTGGAFDDQLDGEDGNDLLSGEAGNDVLVGGTGADRLSGGDGDDSLWLDDFSLADVVDGGAGDDVLSAQLGDGGITLDAARAANITGVERFVLFGGAGDDRLAGGAGADQLYGAAGDDRLAGRDGDDMLLGGDGADLVEGGAGNDELLGQAGDDILLGGDGDDILIGGDGADQLTGGLGADRFRFASLGIDDLIADFQGGQDLIDLRGIDAVAGSEGESGDDAFTFIDGPTHDVVAHSLTWFQDGDHVVLQGDVNGDAVADFAVVLGGTTDLRASDVLL